MGDPATAIQDKAEGQPASGVAQVFHELDRVHAARWSPWLDCQLIACSFAVNAFGKTRVRRWLRRRSLVVR